MAAKKKDKNERDPADTHSLRDDAEEQRARTLKSSPDLAGQSQEQLIHKLRVNQIELETQAEELRRLHIVLEESRDKYLDLYDFAPVGYLTLNDNALITDVNLTGAMLLDAERNEIINHSFERFIAPEDLEKWNLFFANIRRHHIKKQVCPFMFIREDGSTFPAQLEVVRTADSDGVIEIHIAISDITDIREEEKALLESEKKYRDIFENSVIGLFKTTPDGVLIAVNDAFARIYDYSSAAEMTTDNQRRGNLYISKALYANPEDRKEIYRILAEKGNVENFETLHCKRDGTRIWISITARVVRNSEGTLFVEGTIIDITERKREEEAVRESENRYRTLIENMPDGIILHRPSGKILYANNSVASFLHLQDPGVLTGKNVLDFVDPDYRDKVSARMKDAVEKGDPIPLQEEVLIRSDGTRVTVENQGCRVLFRGEYAIQVVVRDITERKRAEEKLRVSEQKYRDIFENSVFGLFQTAPGGRIINVNDAFARMYGFSDAAEMLAADLAVGSPPYANPEDQQEVRRILAEKGKVENYEALHCKQDGTRFWASITARIKRDTEGNLLLYEGTIIDITDRKVAEDALLREKNYSDRLFDAPHDTVFLFEPSTGKPIRWNKRFSEESGYTDDEIAGMKAPRDFYDKADLIKATEAMARNYTGNVTVELSLVTKQGAHIPFEYSATPIKTTDGRTLLLSIGRNITERKQYEKNLITTLKRTQDQQAALGEISFSPHLFSGDVHGLAARLTEVSSAVLGVERASVWLFNGKEDELRCIDLYEVLYDRHSYDSVLKRREYVHEFDALRTAKYIDADDPLTDPRTAGYVKGYLKPNRITSMLDAVIRVSGQNLGTLCFEHVDRSHHWETDEIAFACQLADQIAITLLNRDRKRAEEALRESENNYRSIVENTNDAIYIHDFEGTIIDVNENACRMVGYDKGELVGANLSKIDKGWQLPVNTDLEQLIQQSSSVFERENICKNGLVVPVEVSVKIIHRHGKGIIQAFVRDITGRESAEKALRESEARYRGLIQNVPNYILLHRNGKILFINPAVSAGLGYSEEEVVGSDLLQYVAPESRPLIITMMLKRAAGEPVPTYEIILLTKGGGSRIVEIHGVLIQYEGEPTSLNVLTDITERKRAEERISELNSAFLAFGSNPLVNINILTGLAGKMLQGTCALYNRLEGGMLCSLGMWNTPPDFAPRDQPEGHICNDVILKGGNSPTIVKNLMASSYAVTDPNVKRYQLQTYIGIPVKIGDAFLGSLCVVYQNPISPSPQDLEMISFIAKAIAIEDERRAAIQALQESEERFRLLLQHVPALAVQGYLLDGTTLYWNEASERMYGYSAGEAIGRDLLDLIIPPEMRTAVAESMVLMEQTGQPIPSAELSLMRKDGSRISVYSSHALVTRPGHPTELFCIDVDLSERRKMEEAIRHANKKLTLLSGITRHDINNQLTILMGYLAILEKKQSDPALNEYFGKVSTAAQRISSMIQFTKEYEKIGVNAPVWQDCRTLVDTASKQAPLGQIVVKNELPVGTEVFADPLIVKVCYNLMDNAVRYGGKITTIRFSVEEHEGDHIVVCEDDGEGVIAKEKEKIFERGFGNNTGLGLYLCREILSITGITIKETGEPGTGARFEMKVPKGAWRFKKSDA